MIIHFQKDKSMFLRIADFIMDKILLGDLLVNDRLLSIRKLAVMSGTNPNTVKRGYDLLLQQKIIVLQRGIGFFVTHDGLEISRRNRRETFMKEDMLQFLKNVHLLDIPWSDIKQHYDDFVRIHFN